MGLLRWMRGGDENNDASVAGMSTGLAEIEAIFTPSKRKQTELIEEQSISRFDAETGQPLNMIDLDGGTALVHSSGQVLIDVADDGFGDELDGDGGQQEAGDASQYFDAATLDKPNDD